MTDFDIALNGLELSTNANHATGKTTQRATDDTREAQIEKACRDFESLFIQHMLKQMRQTVPQNGLFSGGSAEQLYTSMLDGEVAKTISNQRGIGLAPALIRQLVEMDRIEKK
jgi:flagellar protein FlgJ